MNFILQMLAQTLLKGLGPINNYKTLTGLAIAVASYVAQYIAQNHGVQIPVLDNEMTAFIGELLTAFGLGDKARKASGKAL